MAPAPHKPPRQHKRQVSLFGRLAELSVQGLLGCCSFLLLLLLCCCHQSRAVKRDCRWLCLFAYVHFHNDLSSSWMFSHCAVNYLPSQNRILPLSPTVFGPNRFSVIPPAASSQRGVFIVLSRQSSAMLCNPELTVRRCAPLLQFYPSHLFLHLGFAWSHYVQG